jgi:cation-dependent mannose-6-phosphate receptor
MQLTRGAILLFHQFLLLSSPVFAVSEKLPPKPCTIHSPTTGSYFDLNTISLSPPTMKDGKKVHKDDREESWHAKGYDYGANFTINFCAPVIEEVKEVVGVENSAWQNVSAFYKMDGKVYSIGCVSYIGCSGRISGNKRLGNTRSYIMGHQTERFI